jgi:hypothetical protein
MKRLLTILTMILWAGFLYGQDAPLVRKAASNLNHRERRSVNTTIERTNKIWNPYYLTPVSSIVGYYMNMETGSDETGDGTVNNPYKTWKKLVENVAPSTTIVQLFVGPGSFTWSEMAQDVYRIRASTVFISGESATTGETVTLTQASDNKFRYVYSEDYDDHELKDQRIAYNPFISMPILDNENDTLIIPNAERFAISGEQELIQLNTDITFDVPIEDPNKTISFRIFNIQPYAAIPAYGSSVGFLSCDYLWNETQGSGYFAMNLQSFVSNTVAYCNIRATCSSSSGQAIYVGTRGSISNSIISHLDLNGQGIDVGFNSWYSVTELVFHNTAGALVVQNATCDVVGSLYVEYNPARGIFNYDEEFGSFMTDAFDTVFVYVDETSQILYGTNIENSNWYYADLRAAKFVPKAGYTLPEDTDFVARVDLDERVNVLLRDSTAMVQVDSLMVDAVTQVQLTGSLTDGTPTDAEIDAVVGLTPAQVGAGWTVTILDSDGSALLYRVESDGTNWQYEPLTIAL